MEDRFFGTPQNPKMEFGRGNHRSAGGFSHGTEASVRWLCPKSRISGIQASNANVFVVFNPFQIWNTPRHAGLVVDLDQKKKCLVSFLWVFNNIREMRLCVHITVITDHNGDTIPPNPGFAHTQTTHPNNMIYLSPEDEWKHWLYAVILTLSFQDPGF